MTVARVTQQYLESAVTPTTRNARVTQQYLESAVTPTTRNARVTQQYIEVATPVLADASSKIIFFVTT